MKRRVMPICNRWQSPNCSRRCAKKEQPLIVLCGKQAIDDDANQTGQMLAALMNWPQATFASKLVVEDGKATVVREIDGGHETIEIAFAGLDYRRLAA